MFVVDQFRTGIILYMMMIQRIPISAFLHKELLSIHATHKLSHIN